MASAPAVHLPTWETRSYLQTVVGKPSPISPDLEEFRGIPYATVPGRWEHSQLRTRLPRDIFDATKNGPKCPQPSGPNDSRTYQSYLPFPEDVTESEFDCLNLFVVRPSAKALERAGCNPVTSKLPVLVWIHGGAFAFGAGTDPMWDPSRLVLQSLERREPIVAISINYRLNLFGFAGSTDLLAAQDSSCTHGLNFGFRDQKVALEWVARNISAFGGDPDRVTVGGQSAGSASVHTHVMETESSTKKPLFRRAIMQSGALGTLGPVPLNEADTTWTALCEHFGIRTGLTAREKVDILRRVTPAKIIEAADALHLGGFSPIVDHITVYPGSIVEGDIAVDLGPVDLRIKPSREPNTYVDVLLGVTDCESCIFLSSPVEWSQIQTAFEGAYKDVSLQAEIMQSYGLVETSTADSLRDGVIQLLCDSMFEIPVHLARQALVKRRRSLLVNRTGITTTPGVHSFHVEVGNPFLGPSQGISHHCVDLMYLFEAFHDGFALADAGIITGYKEPHELMDKPESTAEADSGIGSPQVLPEHGLELEPEQQLQDQPTEEQKQQKDEENQQVQIKHDKEEQHEQLASAGEVTAPAGHEQYKRTNIELCRAIQNQWLDFIVQDKYEPDRTVEQITVYDKDRSTSIQSLTDDAKWQKRTQRWELVARDLDAMYSVRGHFLAL
ncbi:Alpha/Beta hydrolase protein [Xylariales sp. PMI_506]|nr:Alpha/Beta hydrolase protein [Xylariales sp. PMI_506]